VNWEDLVDELDMGIEEINKYLSTKYPAVSEVLDELFIAKRYLFI